MLDALTDIVDDFPWEVVSLLSRLRGNRVEPVRAPHLVANTHPELYPKMTWGGPDDLPLVISDAPELLDDDMTVADGKTLYTDRSGKITGARVLLFHHNSSRTPLHVGLSVKSPGVPGHLTVAGRSRASTDANGVRAGHTVASGYFETYDAQPRETALRPDVPEIVAHWALPAGQTLVAWYDLRLTDQAGGGTPLPMEVQTFVTPRPPKDGALIWDLPLAPWQTERNRSSKIRATVPHSLASLTVRVPKGQDQGLFYDLASMSPSGGEGHSPGHAPFPPTGFPLRGTPGPWLTPTLPLAETAGPWPYQSDPAGFDGQSPATEYVAGWDWADRHEEGDPDPSQPALWYRSERYGVWMRQWNYGEYGCLIEWDVASEDGRPLKVAVTPAREKFSSPWAWLRRPADTGRVAPAQMDRVPWEVVSEGRLYTRPGGRESTAFVVQDRTPSHRILTTVTAGAYAPFRLVVDLAR